MNILQVKETCLYFHDLNKARHFYHELLDLPILGEAAGKHIFFKAGQSVLLCFNPEDSKTKKNPPAHFGQGKYHFAFEVKAEEYDQHKAEITAKGIVITDEVTWEGGVRSFYYEDPEGHVLEIVP